MRPTLLLKALLALAGLALLGYLLGRADPGAVGRAIASVGLAGFALLVLLYAVEFLCDVVAWQLLIADRAPDARWTARLYAVRAAGEAYNVITPLGGMGGEPVKAFILHRRYAVPYPAAAASLVLARTSNVIALIVFLAAGFALMLGDPRISDRMGLLAGLGLAALCAGIGGFFLVQRFRITSRLARRIGPTARVLEGLQALDHHLVDFYTTDRARFATVLGLGLANWVLGALGVWVTLALMGRPVSFADAWIIEAMAQMVRAATFFIPASIGAQEGVIMLVMAAISGDAASGLALALLRRARELLWVAAGLGASAALLGTLRPPVRGTLPE